MVHTILSSAHKIRSFLLFLKLRPHANARPPAPGCRTGTRDRVHAELHFRDVTCFERPSSYYENCYSVTVCLHGSVSTQHGSIELEWTHRDVLLYVLWYQQRTSAQLYFTTQGNNIGYMFRPVLTFGPGIIFLILAHSVYKMWIIQEPNTLELLNKPCSKYSVAIFVE